MGENVSSADNWIIHFPEDEVLEILQHVRELDSLANIAGVQQRVNVSYPYRHDLLAVEVILEKNGPNNRVGELVSRLRLEKAIKELMEPYGAIITAPAETLEDAHK